MDIIKILFTTAAGWIIVIVTVASILMALGFRWWIKQKIKQSEQENK